PPAVVWPVVSDHELYGRLAPNLGKVEVVEGEGTGMRRRCEDTLGRGWTETCTLWNDGHEYAVAVDTADYPYPLGEMEGHWAARPDVGGSLVTMRFRFVPRPGVTGGAFAAVMLLAFRPVLRRILRGWERELAARASAAALAAHR
ncbi:MAG: SRPBCC family protein, partial [Geodermatophilaceae bacterium]|nr:SRPBCC family protein [Geodermatophilaceae bacterium]